MELTFGSPEVVIGLIDGPVLLTHPDLASHKRREIPGSTQGTCTRADSAACLHGTFVAGILWGQRGSGAPAICPGCTLLVRPIYSETGPAASGMPTCTSDNLAEAIVDCIDGGARILNLSLVLTGSTPTGSRKLQHALDYVMSRGALAVAAAGNEGLVGDSVITRHPAVIPVTASDLHGQPLSVSNLGRAIGLRGLMAPGAEIRSLGTDGPQTFSGTSAAAPFVTGAIALLWSVFPRVKATYINLAVLQCGAKPRRSIVPPLLDAWAAYQGLYSISI